MKFSNRYVYIYSIVLVVISAIVLSLAAVLLRTPQQQNIKIEKIQNLLSCVGIASTKTNAEELYNKYFIKEVAIDLKGQEKASFEAGKQSLGTQRPFEINVKKAFDAFKAGDAKALLPVYICKKKDGQLIYVVPLMGQGLWGAIWGNIALDASLNNVVGVNFDHKSETPGLGAEIANPPFQKEFLGKQIFDPKSKEFTSIEVSKKAVKGNSHQVDAISGGTMTSNGVTRMLKDCLSYYLPYFKAQQQKNIVE